MKLKLKNNMWLVGTQAACDDICNKYFIENSCGEELKAQIKNKQPFPIIYPSVIVLGECSVNIKIISIEVLMEVYNENK